MDKIGYSVAKYVSTTISSRGQLLLFDSHILLVMGVCFIVLGALCLWLWMPKI